jgi:hypothetical protein
MTNIRIAASEIYKKHMTIAATDGRMFRKTVMDEIISSFNLTTASAATHYNNCKKSLPIIEGLGRALVTKSPRKSSKGKTLDPIVPDNECYTALEILNVDTKLSVGRTYSFEGLGLARIKFKECVARFPNATWQLINGLGPITGDSYALAQGETVVDNYPFVEIVEPARILDTSYTNIEAVVEELAEA